MSAQIIKDGKEAGQGVAYLDDGTMIVVEEANVLLGKQWRSLLPACSRRQPGA